MLYRCPGIQVEGVPTVLRSPAIGSPHRHGAFAANCAKPNVAECVARVYASALSPIIFFINTPSIAPRDDRVTKKFLTVELKLLELVHSVFPIHNILWFLKKQRE